MNRLLELTEDGSTTLPLVANHSSHTDLLADFVSRSAHVLLLCSVGGEARPTVTTKFDGNLCVSYDILPLWVKTRLQLRLVMTLILEPQNHQQSPHSA